MAAMVVVVALHLFFFPAWLGAQPVSLVAGGK